MLVQNEQNLINQLTEQVESLKAEIIELTHKRDKIFNDISDQRRGKTEVSNEKIVIQKEASILEALLTGLKKIIKKEQKDFYINTDKQKDILWSLSREISKKEKELEEYNKKELIDIDWLNERFKREILEKRQELSNIEEKLVKSQKTIEKHNKYKNETEKKLLKKENELKEFRENLKEREKVLKIKEKRYIEFKEYLASNKK